MDAEAAEFLSSGYLSPRQHEIVRNKVYELLSLVRPQAVPLVDSWGIPDYVLNSSLGGYDGDVYRKLFDFAIREPLNGIDFNIDVESDELVLGQGSASLKECEVKAKL